MKRKIKKESGSSGLSFSDFGHCAAFIAYCPPRVWEFIFELAPGANKKEVERACKQLSEKNRETVMRNLTFAASETAYVAFSMGYVMGHLYNVKDRGLDHLPALKKLFKTHLVLEERKEAERKGLPYIGKKKTAA